MMEHCKINCGADSRKISRAVELIMSFWMRATVLVFEGRLVSKKHRPKKARKFLERNSSGFGSEIMLTPGQDRPIRETETKGSGGEEGGSNLMR